MSLWQRQEVQEVLYALIVSDFSCRQTLADCRTDASSVAFLMDGRGVRPTLAAASTP
jgi:hypothetical protein